MKLVRYTDAKLFYEDTYAILERHEAQNALPLGNVIVGKKGGAPDGWRNTKHWYMATVVDDQKRILLTAIMTPPFNITLYETDNIPSDEALDCLCDGLIGEDIPVPGVTGENGLALRFSQNYCGRLGKRYKIHTDMRLYTLEKVNESIPRVGSLRRATQADLYFLPYWHSTFNEDCHQISHLLEDSRSSVAQAIDTGLLFVLEDEGMPVSMASAVREMVHGRCIGMVYTPPYFRKKGYASSCVAQVSQAVLDMGYAYTCLFTDLANPISNSIYQKIGYHPLCDFQQINFLNEDRCEEK